MSNGLPSMTALLGLLAVAGFQNRDKIAEMIGGMGQPSPAGAGAGGRTGSASGMGGGGGMGGLGGLLGNLGGAAGGAGAGGFLSGGLSELVNRFQQNGHQETVNSWVGHGPNREIPPPQLEQAIGPDVLATLSQQTGLSREELLSRLSRELPNAVDKYTPDGRLPA